MAKNVIGFVLIDAPHSALNNAGTDAGERTDNIVKVKTIAKGRNLYPYVSGQAWRYWWRNTLEGKFSWEMSPIERAEKIAFTQADPFQYADDDVFGYMRAPKKDKGKKKESQEEEEEKSVTLTRTSPLKNSPLISVLSQRPTDDYGVMYRQKDGNPVPYEHQFYSTVLKGIFSLDLEMVGRFSKLNKSGFKNITEPDPKKMEKFNATEVDGVVSLSREVRLKRAKDTISSLQFISGGAKQSSHLTDVTPKLILLACIEGGNHPFMNIVREKDREVFFDFEAFKQTMKDYSESFLTDVFVGHNHGFLNELVPEFNKMVSESTPNLKIKYESVGDAISSFVKQMDELMG